ncbi:MAG TPA: helix-turn-helix domain-containing protein [Acidimicrobiales bacterium]|nr:helix-turn-helix domain-containing protein [Acidimicrobiales bacterium]
MSEDVPVTYARAVGDRLRTLRRQRGLSLLAVEEASDREFKASVLGAYERGERVISVLRLQRLAEFYRVPVDQVLPRPGTAAVPTAAGNGAKERFAPQRPLVIDMVRLNSTESIEGQVIRRYINALQNQRAGSQGTVMAIRAEDLRVIGRFLERDEVAMEMRLVELGLRC